MENSKWIRGPADKEKVDESGRKQIKKLSEEEEEEEEEEDDGGRREGGRREREVVPVHLEVTKTGPVSSWMIVHVEL
eukprot:607976-Hanusia_phi.AAC.1